MNIRGLLRGLYRRLHPQPNTPNLALSIPFKDGHWDYLRIEASGLISLEGWWKGSNPHNLPALTAELNDRCLPLLNVYRAYRPDVAQITGVSDQFCGIVLAWLDTSFATAGNIAQDVRIMQTGKPLLVHSFKMALSKPHYSELLHTDRVFARDNIYCSGPPAPENPEPVMALAKLMHGKILDFGCGSGFLVKALRAAGLDAFGLELQRDTIEKHLHPDARAYVTLYNGGLPTSFPDNSFDCVISAEVLEHTQNHEAAIAELARLCRDTCIITVPDASAIPTCYYGHVVPWHLLEATHRHFFTQASLEKSLVPYFKRLNFLRLYPETVNGIRWYGSLAVIAKKK